MSQIRRRVLLTGGGGFVGRRAARWLTELGHDVVTVSRRPGPGDGRWLTCDLLDESQHRRLFQEARPDTLVHLAWYTEHGRFWSSPSNFAWVNATMSLVRGFAEAGGRRAIVAGSCAEYDWSHGNCVENLTPAEPRTVYGACKDAARRLVERFAESEGLQWAWARIFFPFGAGEPPERLIPSVIAALLDGRPVKCSHGMQYRDFIYAEDAAEAIAHLACGTEMGGIFNVSSGEPTRIASLVNHCATLIRPDARLEFGAVPVPADDPPLLIGDNRRLRGTGWRPRTSWEDGVARMIEDLRRERQRE